MHITIGILAYNEASSIGSTLHSLFSQSIFENETSDHEYEILVVPNGCSDSTAAVASQVLTELCSRQSKENLRFRVEAIERPGKSNAWNELVHRFAADHTDVFVMIDADIEFGDTRTIESSINRLKSDSHARVVVDLPLKHFTKKDRLTLIETISARVSKINLDASVGVAGSFYCTRGDFMRQIWMPAGLSVEDGFLSAMAITDCFRSQPDVTRVVRAANASHYFEGLTNIDQIVQHEVRLVIGTVLNCFLCWDTLLFLTAPHGPGAGPMIRELNEESPHWYAAMMKNQISGRGVWVVPFGILLRRFAGLKGQSPVRFVVSLPVRVIAFFFDIIVYLLANSKLRSGTGVGFW